jgi:hypothetical protein
MADTDASAEVVEQIRAALPCSIELPAGAGKTELVTVLAATLAQAGLRSLVLTHTHAGVDVLRRRARSHEIPRGYATIHTIDGWCFDLVRHFPQLAGITVPDEPNWQQSRDYHAAATGIVTAPPIQRMLRISYDVVIVDEYQDCLVDQHNLVVQLDAIVPAVVVGDRLQGLFNFPPNVPVVWSTDVIDHFPPLVVPSTPWRWHSTNEVLGNWLQTIRAPLLRGEAISLRGTPVAWEPAADHSTKFRVCLAHASRDGSVVALARFRPECTQVAKRLNGSYGVMEELEGKILLEFADIVDANEGPATARGTIEFAVACATGVADKFSSAMRKRLGDGKTASTKRPELQSQCEALNKLISDPSPGRVRETLVILESTPGFTLYCREAWREVKVALQHASLESGLTVRVGVVRSRNHARIVGRRLEKRVVSRPLLVKGLEYDHAIILDADQYTASELYVALTRGRTSVTVISKSQTITPLPGSKQANH